jgi:hypothetical protein
VHFDHSLAGKIALGVFLSLLLSAALAALHVAGTTAMRSGWVPPPR